MSLTINTTPANIDKSAAFNVTTSLVEDSTHVNLRVRADIYHEGIIKATVEKPKGLADFDFSEILKTLVPGLLFARDSGDVVKTGTIGSNLITGWSVASGSIDIWDLSGNAITRCQKTAAASAFLKTNDITVTKGDIYLLYVSSYATIGSKPPYYYLPDSEITHTLPYKYIAVDNNQSKIIMPTSDGTINIQIGRDDGEYDYTAIGYFYKITTNRSTIGNPLAPYFILFTEVYEDAAGVTQTGATASSNVLRYVPAKGDGTAFTEYNLHDNTSLFANKTLRNNVSKFYTPVPYEQWILFFTEFVDIEVHYSKDGAAFAGTIPGGGPGTAIWNCAEGWGVIILNVGEYLASVTSNLRLKILENVTNTQLSEILTVYTEGSAIDERVVLEFDGLVGGKEYLAFEGLKDQQFVTQRNYYSGSKKNRKPISFNGICRQRLETLFKDQTNAEYLKSLLISENVKRLEASYAAPTDVTVITDNVTINKGRELFTNQIEIEYEY